MKRRTRVAIYTGASALWAMAVLGAIGVAHWLGLGSRDTTLLVLAVAIVAILGTFMPAVQLGMMRWREAQDNSMRDREGSHEDEDASPRSR
jgi:uncharacterized membrane protein YhaH (DUF805 family)